MDDVKATAQSLISRSIKHNYPINVNVTEWTDSLRIELTRRCEDWKEVSTATGGATKFWGKERGKEWTIYLRY